MLKIRFLRGFPKKSIFGNTVRGVERWESGYWQENYLGCFWDVEWKCEVREPGKPKRWITAKPPEIWVTVQDEWWKTLRIFTHELVHFLIWLIYRPFGLKFSCYVHEFYHKLYYSPHRWFYKRIILPWMEDKKNERRFK